MTRKRRSNDNHSIGSDYTAKQAKRKKPINLEYLIDIEPLTENQKLLFGYYDQNKNIFRFDKSGTDKTVSICFTHVSVTNY